MKLDEYKVWYDDELGEILAVKSLDFFDTKNKLRSVIEKDGVTIKSIWANTPFEAIRKY